jgi:hypothetical protein
MKIQEGKPNECQPRLAQTQRKTILPSNLNELHREIS